MLSTVMIHSKAKKTLAPGLSSRTHELRQFYGEQYIAVTPTPNSWIEGLIAIPEESWLRGGTPDKSRIVPWGVQSIDQDDIDFWQGCLAGDLVHETVAALIEEIQ